MKRFMIGLTGGIGSGKSAAADMFAELGACIVDADLIAHQVTGPRGTAMPALRAAFGDAIAAADGSMDRQAMRQLAFSDPAARSRLEAIVHPLVRQEAAAQVERGFAEGAPYVIQVIPLLVEFPGSDKRFDRVVVVDCAESVQEARVMARNGLAAEEVRRIMAAQASRAQRLAAADDVIDNGGDLPHLRDQVLALDRQIRAMARGEPDSGAYSG